MQRAAAYARSEALTYHVCVAMVLNVAVVAYESSMDLRNKDTDASQHFFARIECAFSVVYILEMFLKLASYGPDRYWKDTGNRCAPRSCPPPARPWHILPLNALV